MGRYSKPLNDDNCLVDLTAAKEWRAALLRHRVQSSQPKVEALIEEWESKTPERGKAREHEERADLAEANSKAHVAELKEQHEAAVAEHGEMLTMLKQERALLTEKHEENIQQLHAQREENLAKTEEDRQLALRAAVKGHERLLADQKVAHEDTLHAHTAAGRAKALEYEERADLVEMNSKTHVAQMKSQHEMAAAAAAEHEKLIVIIQKEQENLKSLHKDTVTRLHEEWEAKTAQRDEEREAALVEAVEEHERLLADQKAAHEEML
eukprot:SAG11_NODE_3194_length_2620_cov_2.356208_5_plen_266_part_01